MDSVGPPETPPVPFMVGPWHSRVHHACMPPSTFAMRACKKASSREWRKAVQCIEFLLTQVLCPLCHTIHCNQRHLPAKQPESQEAQRRGAEPPGTHRLGDTGKAATAQRGANLLWLACKCVKWARPFAECNVMLRIQLVRYPLRSPTSAPAQSTRTHHTHPHPPAATAQRQQRW